MPRRPLLDAWGPANMNRPSGGWIGIGLCADKLVSDCFGELLLAWFLRWGCKNQIGRRRKIQVSASPFVRILALDLCTRCRNHGDVSLGP